MKKSKLIIISVTIILISILSFIGASAITATSDQPVVITNQEGEYTPLCTTSPDSTLKEHSVFNLSNKDYQLFYTQTTMLALLAGYLILFKKKGLKNTEKMHRRRTLK